MLLTVRCSLNSGQQFELELPVAPISLAKVSKDDNNKIKGMSDAELYFKYKAEQAFAGKLKELVKHMMHDFNVKI